MFEIQGKYTTAKVFAEDVESSCISQIQAITNHCAFTNPISIMPDTHTGKGSVIGFTMEMTDKICPNVIGVDIGCGMLSMGYGEKNIYHKQSFEALDRAIRVHIPFGTNVHRECVINMEKTIKWSEITNFNLEDNFYSLEWFKDKCQQIGISYARAINSIGTLGGGNHFIEIGKSNLSGQYFITVHSGSRNFGKCICDYWQKKAADNQKELTGLDYQMKIVEIRKTTKNRADIPKRIQELRENLGIYNCPSGLEYLSGEDRDAYLNDMVFAQHYASWNRETMLFLIGNILKMEPEITIESVHNYIDPRDKIIRKGAIRSYSEELSIIPFNMRDGLLICKGKSDPEWNYSAPHGAGRVMSRSEAKGKIDLEVFKKQMKNIYSTSVCTGTLDEAPGAYKNSDIIEILMEPTVEIIDKIVPVHNLKALGGNYDYRRIKKLKKSIKKQRRKEAIRKWMSLETDIN